MILEGIISVVKGIVLFIINLLPKFPDISSFTSTSLSPFFDVLCAINFLVDLKVVSACIVAYVVFMNIDFVFSIIMWIVRKIPGVS